MEKLPQELEKTVDDFNNINQTKGFKAEYSLWNRTYNTILCQMIVTRIPDKVTRDKLFCLTLNWTFMMRFYISSMIL